MPGVAFTEAQILAWLSPLLWPFLRVLAVFTSAPVLSSRAVPMRVKVALALFVALACQATIPSSLNYSIASPDALAVVFQQVLIGLSIGFAVRLVFAAVELAGEVVGFQMGLNFASFFDPSMNSQSSAVARFFGQMATLLFVVLNGHIMVLLAVTKSFDAFPVSPRFLESLAAMQLYRLGTDLFSSALWIALPMVGLLLFTNLALGVISRVAPQINIFAVGFPVTLVVGIVGIAATLPALDQPMLALMERVIGVFSGV
ncbi:flagellar biosynthetic protein FliR [Rhodoferax sp. TH121]|uniref:flagellar biosynthetic protein FliR n=1 Tax=Rhodoferax sp. TH121 TaxID=2022803 RepID=UPI000B966E0A|nr:flagellar biosynthetic protein FliR [Rhodoferax sp. TH121]OYQ43262.1 flagellar biosynthetic protein FliR [Rhodoferax sp. TH121]